MPMIDERGFRCVSDERLPLASGPGDHADGVAQPWEFLRQTDQASGGEPARSLSVSGRAPGGSLVLQFVRRAASSG
jgi:hypothetical protein